VYIAVRFKQLSVLTTNNMKEKVYCEGRGSILMSLNLSRHDALIPEFVIILIAFF
jgi:hypothetical protein